MDNSSSAKPPAGLGPTCDLAADEAAAELVRILDAYMVDLQAGKAPDKAALLAQHPAHATQLEACLAGLEFIHGGEAAPGGRPQRLGDFRIIREVGRGGMGAVYEAEQISLRRRVALKILRFGGVFDAEAIERFQREAETIAALHHTNIVPIYADGNEHGVSYYAMQFIDGRSLAELLVDQGQALPAEQVAEWGLQAADALTHAHQRGVVHRDVKPSNLLIDADGRLWLTDFGLARRLDDATLSLTGAILGTPRYMSPEQAAGQGPIDSRTDLFSLGATLYELLTARPAFAGDTPHEVIQQILDHDPQPIREFARNVPRDLATIVMKCLAKQPADRYASAAELAADLRAFLEGRPIRARRPGPLERAARWLKTRQRGLRVTATAVALTLLFTAGGVLVWRTYDAWRQARIQLSALSPPLVAEVRDLGGNVLRVETLPMQNAASFPAGDYRLRVSGNGTLSQTLDLTLNRGAEQEYTLDLQDQMLWTPRTIERGFDVVDFGDAAGLVSWNEDGVALHKQRAPLLQWSMKMQADRLPDPSAAPGLRWPWNSAAEQFSGFGPFDRRPWVASHARDVDGDGVGDLLIAARHQAWLMALSGQDGRVLWFAPRGEDVGLRDAIKRPEFPLPVYSGVVSQPIDDVDCDADGAADLIVTLIDVGSQSQQQQDHLLAKCWVEAISGKTGLTLWRYDLPADWFELAGGEETPYALRWFAGSGGGYMRSGGGGSNIGRHRSRTPGRSERRGTYAYRPALFSKVPLPDQDQVGVAIVAGNRFLLLDPSSGQPRTAQSLQEQEGAEVQSRQAVVIDARPGTECRLGDIDGDGLAELIFLRLSGATATPNPTKPKLVVWSPLRSETLWSKDLPALEPQQQAWSIPAPEWPLVTDLNGDQKCEILVPTESSGSPGISGASEIPWGVLTVLSGDCGESLWSRRLATMDQQVDRYLAGPDIDGDGFREVYTVTLEGQDFRLHVDALSGRTGRTLWHNSQMPPPSSNTSREFQVHPPHWWRAGADGWPQLVTHITDAAVGGETSYAWTFSAASGELTHVGQDITSTRTANVDQDEVEDLLVFHSKSTTAYDLGGRLHCIRGVARESWRRLGAIGEPAADFDGDGVRDLIHRQLSTLTARSGATGKRLWTTRPVSLLRESGFRSAAGDLNGDGVDDLIFWSHTDSFNAPKSPLSALSGKSGRPLWNATEVTSRILRSVLAAEAHDLDGDGELEVLWLAMLDHGYPVTNSLSSVDTQLWLFVVSGQTGRLRWSQPLSPAFGQASAPGRILADNTSLSLCIADADGDGVHDVLAPEVLPDGSSLATRVLSGRDGETLWTRPCSVNPQQQSSLENWIPPAAVDLEGDGQVEFVLLEVQSVDDAGQPMRAKYRAVALEGKQGQERWSYLSNAEATSWSPMGVSKSDVLRPRIFRFGAKRRVALTLPGPAPQLVILDPDGQAHLQPVQWPSLQSGLWPCDIDGDGVDEAAFVKDEKLCVSPADRLDQPLWSRKMGSAGQLHILDVIPGDQHAAPRIVVADDATDNSVLGLSAMDGDVVWSCPGPIPRDGGTYVMPSQIALLDWGANQPPHVYYAFQSVACCRQAASPPDMHHVADLVDSMDDRWRRDLPWVSRDTRVSQVAEFLGWACLFATLLIVLPVGYVVYLISARRFTLSAWQGLPVVTGLFLVAALMPPPMADNDFASLAARLSIGFALSPAVASFALLARWWLTGESRRVFFWLAFSIAVSVALGAVLIYYQQQATTSTLPEVKYDWNYWYLIWLPGAYLTAWLLVATLPIRRLALAFRRRSRRASSLQTHQPS